MAHLVVFAVVNTLLWINWLFVYAPVGEWFPWPLLPLVAWGIALARHARRAYGRGGAR